MRPLIIFTYYVQAAHSLLGAVHLYCAMTDGGKSGVILNLIFALLNGCFFVNAANWRARMQAQQR